MRVTGFSITMGVGLVFYPDAGGSINSVQNGMLLGEGVHTLFDLNQPRCKDAA